jgi:hypothetical protein
LVAAAAQELGSGHHCDSNYDTLADFMEFESVWLAQPEHSRERCSGILPLMTASSG